MLHQYQKKYQLDNLFYFRAINDILFILKNDTSSFYIYDLNSDLKIVKTDERVFGGGIYILDEYIIDQSFKGLEINSLNPIDLFNSERGYLAHNKQYIIASKRIEKFKVELKLHEKGSLKEIKTLDLKGWGTYFDDKNRIVRHTTEVICSYFEFEPNWQQNLSSFGEARDWDGKEHHPINKILSHNGKLLVLKGTSVICLDLESGEILWHIKSETSKAMGVIDRDHLYTASGTGITKIHIASGEVDYQIRLQEGDPLNKEIWFCGILNLTLHQGKLWANTFTGESCLVCIDKETAYYDQVIPLEQLGISAGVRSFEFYRNKLFVHDKNGDLHIFERQ